MKKLLPLLCSLSLLASCNYLPEWMGNEEEETILPGERIALKRGRELFEAEIPEFEGNIQLPPQRNNAEWNQLMGSASNVFDHLAFSEEPSEVTSVSVGDGDEFEAALLPSPVVSGGKVFALDGNGTISAHSSETLEKLWESDALENMDGDDVLLGGGLAAVNEVIYASNDEGRIIALAAEDGKLYWSVELRIPLRSAPRLVGRSLIIQSADNQLISLNRSSGETLWLHQGLNDQASQLQATVPAAGGDIVLATYSSGEVTALSLKDGSVVWSDMLAGSAQTALQEDRFGVFSALITPRVSFAGSAQSFAAYFTQNGRRIWERRIPLSARPWLTGTILYMLTSDAQLMAVNGGNGKVLWVHNLPNTDDDTTIVWQQPIVASDKVWMIGSHGIMLAFDAQTGEEGLKKRIAENVAADPVIANETLYLLDRSATLHALR